MPDPIYRNVADGQDLVLIAAGATVFGAPDDDPLAEADEKPLFQAVLPDYYLGRYCVTYAQYAAFLTAVQPSDSDLAEWIWIGPDSPIRQEGVYFGITDFEHDGDHPVGEVSWYGAAAYCSWSGLRLPTELEWEKGARGVDGRAYPWGDEWAPNLCRHRANRYGDGTCGVSEYGAGVSYWGIYNMSGNIWEWCADWYVANAYRAYALGNLAPPPRSEYKVVRGASWGQDEVARFRCAARDWDKPDNPYGHVGFRCAGDPKPPQAVGTYKQP